MMDLGPRRDVRAIIVAGKNRAFSAGADIKELVKLTQTTAKSFSLFGQGVMDAVAACAKPTIAAVHGYALGGGFELALACDVRLAAYSATVGLPEVRLGILPGAGGTYRLLALIGEARARRLILSGEHLAAKEAHRLGLLDELVADEFLLSQARKLAASFFEGDGGAQAHIKKRFFAKGESAQEARAYAACFGPVQRGRMEAFLK